jgi:hypothetical protein
MPGARHGRYTDPLVPSEETTLVVRMCGASIIYPPT